MKRDFGGARLEAVATTQGRADDCTDQGGAMGIEQRGLRERIIVITC